MRKPTRGKEKMQRKLSLGGSSLAVKIYVVYHSMYGNIERLAEKAVEGANLVQGVEATQWQVPETLSTEELAQLGAPAKSDVPIIHPNELSRADGFIFCFPTRFGMIAAKFKAFLDATQDLCKTQQLAGKPAGMESSPAPAPKVVDKRQQSLTYGHDVEEVKGGSKYGAVTYAERNGPTWLEWMRAFQQGYFFSSITKQLK